MNTFLLYLKMYSKEFKLEVLKYLETHTWKETSEKFNVSQMSLKRWKEKYKSGLENEEVSENSTNISLTDPKLKKSMKSIFDEMWESLSKSNQKKLMKKYENEIPKIMEVLN